MILVIYCNFTHDTHDLRRNYEWYLWFKHDLRMIPGKMRDTRMILVIYADLRMILLIDAGNMLDTRDLRVIYAWYLIQCVIRLIHSIYAWFTHGTFDLRRNYEQYSWFTIDLRMKMHDTHNMHHLRGFYAWYSWFTQNLWTIMFIYAWFTHDTWLNAWYAWYAVLTRNLRMIH